MKDPYPRMRKWLTTSGEAARVLPRLRSRTARSLVLDVLDPGVAYATLRKLSPHQLLVVAAAAGPGLFGAMRTAVGYDTGLWTLADYFREDFPPAIPIPGIPSVVISGSSDTV